MQELHAGVRAGAVVHARGDMWTVVSVQRFDGCALVALEGRGPDRPGRRTTLITPFDAITRSPVSRIERRRRPRVVAAVLAAIGRERRERRLWTAVDGAFTPFAWQLSPALAVLGGATRLLLADAVGLGKTVQAGLVVAELMARGLVERTLVLTPAGLRESWVEELRTRFHLPAEVLDQASLLAHGEWRAAGANPWTRVPIVVSSIDLVKRAEVRAAVDDEPLDLLIVDEAHHCTPGSDRGAVVARLARSVPWLVLASATPHAGDARAFRFLLDLGRVDPAEPPMPVFRRGRHDAALLCSRSTHVLAVTLTDAERRLQAAVHAYARELCQGPMPDAPGLRLVGGVLARRATSSALAARRTLARRLAALSGAAPSPVERQAQLPWTEVEDDEPLDHAWLGTPGLKNSADECDRLRALIADADEACGHPSKLIRLRRLLARAGEPAIVFTEFRDTLDACVPLVSGVGPIRCLHGGMDVADRRRALADFLQGRARVLLATDVASEGLNLHERARLVVTIEWPWSPQRLEQRVGRVDRLGQTRRVHAVHLTSRGTFEDTVVAHLLARQRTADDNLDRSAGPVVGAHEVEAAVLGEGDRDGPVADPPASLTALDAAAADEAGRIPGQRRLSSHALRTTTLPAWCLPARTRVRTSASGCGQGRPARVAVVFEICNRSRAGRIDARSIVGIEVTLARQPAHRREWKQVCRALARDVRVREAALRPARSSVTERPWQAVVSRLAAIGDSFDATPLPGVQASLFDRRAIREARAREAAAQRMQAHLQRKAQWLSSPGDERDLSLLAVVPLP